MKACIGVFAFRRWSVYYFCLRFVIIKRISEDFSFFLGQQKGCQAPREEMASAIKTRNLVHKTSLLSKFKGSLVGAVVGDCLGAPFEASWDVKLEEVKGFLSQLHSTGAGT